MRLIFVDEISTENIQKISNNKNRAKYFLYNTSPLYSISNYTSSFKKMSSFCPFITLNITNIYQKKEIKFTFINEKT